ncbi:Flagellin N-methylase [Thalassoglobus neptunius]|uniref:Flagellin N-methylase n=1 Tax=Thalassoglobus neptunius TaxID=1938619 RepID=A0A5C5X6L2_9PLAN|nr:YkgJ family cysteine cluster protein [Thalassoglobus neptunius]TWT57903.1 Flagellin N-methylase [Thalassoglobus neptunius]
MSSDVWYQDGLQFSCSQCGNCCTGTPGYVWVTDKEVEAIAEYLDKPVGEIRLLYTRPARGIVSLREFANGDCIFFDGEKRGCQIYPVRPAQCQTWPFWRVNIDTPEKWEETKRICPGAGQGEFVSLESIEEQLERTHL